VSKGWRDSDPSHRASPGIAGALLPSRREFIRLAATGLLIQAGSNLGLARLSAIPAQQTVAGLPLGYSLRDVAHEAGLEFFQVCGGDTSKKYILETTGSGVAFIDYDNDGWISFW
jgi:hypothetical protein